jgi:hypothetical protein
LYKFFILKGGSRTKEDYIFNNQYELSVKSASGNSEYLDKIYSNDDKGNILHSDTSDIVTPQTISTEVPPKTIPKRMTIPKRIKGDYILNNQ